MQQLFVHLNGKGIVGVFPSFKTLFTIIAAKRVCCALGNIAPHGCFGGRETEWHWNKEKNTFMIINQAVLKKIANLDGQTCFGCGEINPIGLQMQFLTDGQRVYSFVTVPPTMAGWDQTVHGGIISTILDEIMGWSVIYLLKKIGVTKSITVDFIKPLRVGKRLTVVGAIEEIQSERQVVVTGEIYSDEDILCAKATGKFGTMSTQAAVRLGVMSSEYMERFVPILNQNQGA